MSHIVWIGGQKQNKEQVDSWELCSTNNIWDIVLLFCNRNQMDYKSKKKLNLQRHSDFIFFIKFFFANKMANVWQAT